MSTSRLLDIQSVDEVPIEDKIKQLLQYADFTGSMTISTFCDNAAEVFVAVFDKLYPNEVRTVRPSNIKDPLLATMMMQEGLEEKMVLVMTSLKRILKRMYGSSTLDTCNVPRPLTAEGHTPGRPGITSANKKKKNKIKVPTTEEMFRRSITGGDARAGLVKRVLETTVASRLQAPKQTLEKSIYRNAGHSLKILAQIDVSDVMNGDPAVVGAMLGLVYQEYFRVVVMETPVVSAAGSMDEAKGSKGDEEEEEEAFKSTLKIDVRAPSGPTSPIIATSSPPLSTGGRRASVAQGRRAI